MGAPQKNSLNNLTHDFPLCKFGTFKYFYYLCTANSRRGCLHDTTAEGADIFVWRLLTLVFDHLKPRKFQKL